MQRKATIEFEQLWHDVAGRVRAYAFSMCRNWSDADDIVQDCYLRALKNWSQFDARGSRKSWLFGIARRACADWFRHNRHSVAVLPAEHLSDCADNSLDKEKNDDAEAVWGAVKELKSEQADVINLRFAAQLSYADISQALGIPLGTVRSRLHRGLKAIRKKIKELENGS